MNHFVTNIGSQFAVLSPLFAVTSLNDEDNCDLAGSNPGVSTEY